MADAFISYKKEDFQVAERVVTGLRNEGFSVWWDDGLTPKTAWDEELEREIAAAATVIVLWTPRSINSEWVRTEAHYGQDRGKLIPVMMEDCSIPIAFMLRQTVKLCDWRGEREDRNWRKLLTWIADLTSTKPGNANIPQALGAAQPNRFRDAIGHLPSGDPIVDGAFVNASTPAGTAFRDGEQRPVMRILPKGAFLLGSPAADPDYSAVEGPQKRIEIPTPFAIGAFPILVSEYQTVMGSLPSVAAEPAVSHGLLNMFRRPPPAPAAASVTANPSAPITQVSYDDAEAFVARLSTATGETYRIPSETEWEYACRAGTRGRYCFGETIDASHAAFAPAGAPIAPGSFPANAFGLYDMHGNVREWTGDLWHESYDMTPADGSAATAGQGSMRVVRGGAWCDGAAMLRSAARMRATQFSRSNAIGFRVVRVLS
jgi:formylglycine-generating enzyme required for sulfatase activity